MKITFDFSHKKARSFLCIIPNFNNSIRKFKSISTNLKISLKILNKCLQNLSINGIIFLCENARQT